MGPLCGVKMLDMTDWLEGGIRNLVAAPWLGTIGCVKATHSGSCMASSALEKGLHGCGKERHRGWFWAAGEVCITGLGPGIFFSPLLLKYYGLQYGSLFIVLGGLLTLAAQCQLSRLFGRLDGASPEISTIFAADKTLFGRGTSRMLNVGLLVAVSGISLMYLVVIAGQAALIYVPDFAATARSICLGVMTLLAMLLLCVLPLAWVKKAHQWNCFLTFSCVALTLVLLAKDLCLLPEETWTVARLGETPPNVGISTIPVGVTHALFMMANYPAVGLIRSRCPSRPYSIFALPMVAVIIPCFLFVATSSMLIFGREFGIDVLTSASPFWRLYMAVRYLFGVDRFVAVVFLLDHAITATRIRNHGGPKTMLATASICLAAAGVSFSLVDHLPMLMIAVGLIFLVSLFLVFPSIISAQYGFTAVPQLLLLVAAVLFVCVLPHFLPVFN